MTTMNLSKIPLSDYPDLVSAILDGQVRLHFSMVAHSEYSFLEEDGSIWHSRNGRYEVVHPSQVAKELQARFRGSDLGGISLPELRDDKGNRLYVIHSDEDFAPDDMGRQGITLVRFPYDQFQIEWLEPSKKTIEPRGPGGHLVKEYLEKNPSGGISGLRKWAAEQYGASRIQIDESWHLKWVDWQGEEQSVPEKTLSNLLSEYRETSA